MPFTEASKYFLQKSIEVKQLLFPNTKTPMNYCVLKSCYLLPKLWTVITNDFYYFCDFDQFYSLKTKYMKLINDREEDIKKKSRNVIENKGLYFLLGCDDNYYHNIINFLPKLTVISQYLSDEIQIIINDEVSSKVEEFIINHLEFVGCKNYKFFRVKWDESIHKFEKIIFIDSVNIFHTYHFYNYFYKKYLLKENKNNIYVLRGDVLKRKVINEDEVIDYFKSLNFKIIDCAKYSIYDQMKIFSNAKNIIAPSGASLANLIFAPKLSNYIEIRSTFDGEYSSQIQEFKKFNLILFVHNERIGEGIRTDIKINIDSLGKLVNRFI